MKFYQGLLPRIIWDPVKGAPKIQFNRDGIFETNDEDLIHELKTAGYLVERDLYNLRDFGTLPHGGFERPTLEAADLPSGRKPIEEMGDKPVPRRVVIPRTEEEEVMANNPNVRDISKESVFGNEAKSKPAPKPTPALPKGRVSQSVKNPMPAKKSTGKTRVVKRKVQPK